MLAKLFGTVLQGIEALLVSVEVSVTKGIGYQITGLPDESIRESLSRIAIALQHNGYQMPRTKLLIHLGPANMRKSGSALDLPIALGILLATEQITDIGKLSAYIIAGELALDGKVKSVTGALCRSELSSSLAFKGIVVPQVNAEEAALIPGSMVYGVNTLKDIISFINNDDALKSAGQSTAQSTTTNYACDFKHIVGQSQVKRALEISAAGGHHLLLNGFPGTGKSMLTKCLPSILPPMNDEEIIAITKIHSITNKYPLHELIRERPYREIHHTTSIAGLIGGGLSATPGEITLAHNGVLFIDEFTECKTSVLEALRQPLEEKKINVTRASITIQYPASFTLVAAMNPCLCGYHHHPLKKCTCSKRALWWHKRKLSGPILDRFDLCAATELLDAHDIFNSSAINESSAIIRERVIASRKRQADRLVKHVGLHCNADLSHDLIKTHCVLDEYAQKYLRRKWDELGISMRGLDKILKVARTIADLSGSAQITLPDIAEAIFYKMNTQTFILEKALENKKPVKDYSVNGQVNDSFLLQ